MDGHLSDLLCLLNNGRKSYSIAANLGQHFNNIMSRTYIHKYMTFRVLKQINLIGTMKTFTKPNFNICMEKRLTIPKNLRDKRIMVMNKKSEIYGACRNKTTLHQFFTKH